MIGASCLVKTSHHNQFPNRTSMDLRDFRFCQIYYFLLGCLRNSDINEP